MKSQKFWKSPGNLLYSYLHFCSLIERINIYIHIYSFNQTIVSFICNVRVKIMYTLTFLQNVWSWKFGLKSWKSTGHHVYEYDCSGSGPHHIMCVFYRLKWTCWTRSESRVWRATSRSGLATTPPPPLSPRLREFGTWWGKKTTASCFLREGVWREPTGFSLFTYGQPHVIAHNLWNEEAKGWKCLTRKHTRAKGKHVAPDVTRRGCKKCPHSFL